MPKMRNFEEKWYLNLYLTPDMAFFQILKSNIPIINCFKWDSRRSVDIRKLILEE